MTNFKKGDEVAQTRYSFGDKANLGPIVLTSERQDAGNQDTYDSNHQDVEIIKFVFSPYLICIFMSE